MRIHPCKACGGTIDLVHHEVTKDWSITGSNQSRMSGEIGEIVLVISMIQPLKVIQNRFSCLEVKVSKAPLTSRLC